MRFTPAIQNYCSSSLVWSFQQLTDRSGSAGFLRIGSMGTSAICIQSTCSQSCQRASTTLQSLQFVFFFTCCGDKWHCPCGIPCQVLLCLDRNSVNKSEWGTYRQVCPFCPFCPPNLSNPAPKDTPQPHSANLCLQKTRLPRRLSLYEQYI